MFENVNEVAVLVSAILALAVGSIWYSPVLFGPMWMRSLGRSEVGSDLPRGKLLKLLSLAAVANLFLFFSLAQFVAFAQGLETALTFVAGLLIIIVGAAMASGVIWEERPFSYFLINLGYLAVVILGGMAVLWYWPW